MCAQIFFVTSVRGSGSVPTILARCSEGCIGFIKALFFALGVVFAIFALHPCRKRTQLHDHKNCSGSGWQMCIKLDETTPLWWNPPAEQALHHGRRKQAWLLKNSFPRNSRK